ncbi:MAG: hypothetical protein DLM50_07340 [Candidatus Meridianibacter frigidus]|nr:MAG: hypothetical protein DLM50_07340 [Candidatus Eremiobacteraeota bacterium]
MRRAIVASVRTSCSAALLVFLTYGLADAVPPLANGQGVSCQTCHTTFPGLTAYGMMTMMSNFQNLDWKKQHQAFPLALRLQIQSYLSNKDRPGSTTTKTLSLFTAGFLGRNFTYYAEQPIVDTGEPGITEQLWLSWNGLFGGTNSLQLGKYHTPFPFMPAHGWTLSDYLLATQDNGQNTFEPNDSHWGLAFNGMSNEFMYNLAYLAGNGSVQHAFDYNRADSPRTLDFNFSYGGMTKPYTIGINAMRGTTPLRNDTGTYVADDSFTREGLYYSYQTSKLLFQTMYYTGWDEQPDIGLSPGALHGFMFEAQRDIGWHDHLLARFDVASSDTFNRQYVLSWGHHFAPNFKLTSELAMGAQRPQIGFALDWAGPFVAGQRFLWKPPGGALLEPVQMAQEGSSAPPPSPAPTATSAPIAPVTATPPSMGDANNGAKLVQNNGCMGCHGTRFQGGVGPKLFGIEHTLSFVQIFDFIKHPRAPMPNFGFSDAETNDIVAYLSNLDGGNQTAGPIVTFTPERPLDDAVVTVRFPTENPSGVTVRALMQMGVGSHHIEVVLHQTEDPHVWQGTVHFSMGGPWTVQIFYGNKHTDIPLQVGQ